MSEESSCSLYLLYCVLFILTAARIKSILDYEILRIDAELNTAIQNYGARLGSDMAARAIQTLRRYCSSKSKCQLIAPFIFMPSKYTKAIPQERKADLESKFKDTSSDIDLAFIRQLTKCVSVSELDVYSQVKKLARGRPWLTFAMVREPAERFISGYMMIYKPGICKEGDLENLKAVLLRTYKLSQKFASGTSGATRLLWHLAPQNWYCELRHNFDAFKLIHYSSKNRGKVIADLENVLTEGGVDFSQIELITSQVSNGTTRHATNHLKATAEYEKLMQNVEIQELLTKIYFWDYVLFNFPLPQLRNDTSE